MERYSNEIKKILLLVYSIFGLVLFGLIITNIYIIKVFNYAVSFLFISTFFIHIYINLNQIISYKKGLRNLVHTVGINNIVDELSDSTYTIKNRVDELQSKFQAKFNNSLTIIIVDEGLTVGISKYKDTAQLMVSKEFFTYSYKEQESMIYHELSHYIHNDHALYKRMDSIIPELKEYSILLMAQLLILVGQYPIRSIVFILLSIISLLVYDIMLNNSNYKIAHIYEERADYFAFKINNKKALLDVFYRMYDEEVAYIKKYGQRVTKYDTHPRITKRISNLKKLA